MNGIHGVDSIRAAFEWWASDEGESPASIERAGNGYKLAQTQAYWMAWNAAISARPYTAADGEHAPVGDERAAFEAWAEVEYRNSDEYTNRDFRMGLAAWKARAALASAPAASVEPVRAIDTSSGHVEKSAGNRHDESPWFLWLERRFGPGVAQRIIRETIEHYRASRPATDAAGQRASVADERAEFEAACGDLYVLEPGGYQAYAVPVTQAAYDGWKARAALAHKQQEDADPLQPAANWLVNGAGLSVYALAGNLMIGYNRAERLYDTAIAAQQGKKEVAE